MKERSPYFDNAKAILIFFVVFGHLVDVICTSDSGHLLKWIFLCIWSFHMPAFLFLAGLMDHPRKDFPAKRILLFVVLGFLLKLCNNLVLLVFPDVQADLSLLSDKNFPWFLFVLAAHTAVAYWLQKLAGMIAGEPGRTVFWVCAIGVSVLVALAAGYVSSIGDFLYLSRFFVFLPFYLAGYQMQPAKVEEFAKRPVVKWAGAIGLVLVFAMFYLRLDGVYHLRPLFTGRNPYSEWGLSHGGALLRVAAYVISSITAGCFLAVVPHRRMVFSEAGRESLSVYCWHYYVIFLLDGMGVMVALGGERLRVCIPLFLLIAVAEVAVFSHKPFTTPLHKLQEKLQ